ncbi:MAG: UDP-N-acetylglucosamine--N-acetylmuramyl-(pentapeptide) pyrophosphoryl-undecaprenol N-acetylglucosamine transferase [Planctomycetota bacterium]|nr:MAG: UDP-N-acetylglucosamine--N-acetylmuramyl-(pentapeptide) pyrophosphoryl-undecaprenol N-acetylglucosamine transferase [Planctomycetota bacterium]
MRVAFVGGGTGGHLAPGIAVAEQLREAGHDVRFVVAGREVEASMLSPRALPSVALFGAGGRPPLRRLDQWWRATRRWRRELAGYDPHVVVVLGGWVALPCALSGWGARPSVLVETNARPGKVQRLLSGRVDHVCLGAQGPDMPQGRRSTRLTGTPVPGWRPLPRAEALAALGLDAQRHTLLIFGGSQGAADLDALLPAVAARLAARDEAWQLLHLRGPGRVVPAASSADVPLHSLPFQADMASVWAAADAALCRAGAGTVAELAASGTPALLLPYPHHRDRHQAANAEDLVRVGAALQVPDDDPCAQRSLPALLDELLDDLPARVHAARALARPGAARRVAEVVSEAGAGA